MQAMQTVSTLSFAKQEDFSRFGNSFQESLCRLILLDRPFADQIGEVLDFNFFELKYLQVFAQKIYAYKEKKYALLLMGQAATSTSEINEVN